MAGQSLRPDHGGPGGQHHRLRLRGQHLFGGDPLAKPQLDAQPLQLHELVVGNAGQRLTDGQARLQLRLAPGQRPLSPQGDLVATLGGGHGRFQTRNTGANHRDAFRLLGGRQVGIELVGVCHARVVVAGERQPLDDSAPARVARHTVADGARHAPLRLERPRRVGDQGPGQAHQRSVAPRQNALGFGRVSDAPQRHHRHLGRLGLQTPKQGHKGQPGVAVVGQVHLQRVVVCALCIGQQVDLDLGHQMAGNVCRELGVHTIAQAIVAGQLHRQHEAIAANLSNSLAHLHQQAATAGQRAAVVVLAQVGMRR